MAGRLRYEDYHTTEERVQKLADQKRRDLAKTSEPETRMVLQAELTNLEIQLACLAASVDEVLMSEPSSSSGGDSIVDSFEIQQEMRNRIKKMRNFERLRPPIEEQEPTESPTR